MTFLSSLLRYLDSQLTWKSDGKVEVECSAQKNRTYMLCFGDSATCRGIRLKKIDKYVELKHVNHCIAALTFDKDRTEDFF